MNEWKRFLVSGPFDVNVGGHLLHCKPSGNDIPVAFHVEANRDHSQLLIKFRYLSGMDEPTLHLTFGTTIVQIGETSGRVFQMELRGMRGKSASELGEAISKVMTLLSGRTPLAGPRVNYEAARRGLSENVADSTPTWMVSALERLRGSDPQTAR